MILLDLDQGSDAWLSFRATRRMASESAALLRVAPWYPRTPYDLWMVKSGRSQIRDNEYMAHGRRYEATARALYERQQADLMMPFTVDGDGGYAASLDGLSFDADRILEVKCPWKGSASDLWARAARGQVPPHYQCQVQHQIMVTGAKRADFAVYAWDTDELTIIAVKPDPAMQARIRAAWDGFWPDYAAGRAPGENYLDLIEASLEVGH
jgi:putative phage-type endonuclease